MPINLNRFDAITVTDIPVDPPINGGVLSAQFKYSYQAAYDVGSSIDFFDDGSDGRYALIKYVNPTGTKYLPEYFNELTLNAVFRGGTSGTSSYEVDYQLFHKDLDTNRFIPTTDLVSHFFQPISGIADNISVVKFTDTNFDRNTVQNIDMTTQSTRKPFDNSTGFGFFPLITNFEYQKSVILHNGIFNNYQQQELYLYIRVKVFTVGQPFPSLKLTVQGVTS